MSTLRINKEDGGNESSFHIEDYKKLKDTKRVLENKLRKYAAHCQKLEEEKVTTLKKIKSISRDESDDMEDDDDLIDAFSNLYDRLKNTEEECEALMTAEKKASGYLMQIDRLQDDNTTLEKNMTMLQDNVAGLTKLNQELHDKLSDTNNALKHSKDELLDFQSMAESAKGNVSALESEKNRQVSYLEQENLQLMTELKAKDKQISALMAEKNVNSMESENDCTDDLNGFSCSMINQSQMNNKENEHTNYVLKNSNQMDSINAAKVQTRSKSERIKPKKLKKGLGEGDINDDNTTECNQS